MREGGQFTPRDDTVIRDIQRVGVWISSRAPVWNSPMIVRVVLGVSTEVEFLTSMLKVLGSGLSTTEIKQNTEMLSGLVAWFTRFDEC